MKENNLTLLPIKAVYIFLMVSILASFGIATNYYLKPTEFLIDNIAPTLTFIFNVSLLIYFHRAPAKRIEQTINYYAVITILAFVPATLFFVIGATMGKWIFIDVFPPIPALTLIAGTSLLLMLPKANAKYVFLTWFLVSAPVVFYFITHPLELDTPRGRDLFILYGPGSLLLIMIIPYQQSLLKNFAKISEDLQATRKSADTDFLTNTFNRRGLLYWLSQNASNNAVFSIILIDIDHFKDINDRYGHDVGDKILLETASILDKTLAGQGCLARWGGDEFIIILKNSAPEFIQNIAKECLNELRATDCQLPMKPTCSFGISKNGLAKDFDNLFTQADNNLYLAKNKGRDQIGFSE